MYSLRFLVLQMRIGLAATTSTSRLLPPKLQRTNTFGAVHLRWMLLACWKTWLCVLYFGSTFYCEKIQVHENDESQVHWTLIENLFSLFQILSQLMFHRSSSTGNRSTDNWSLTLSCLATVMTSSVNCARGWALAGTTLPKQDPPRRKSATPASPLCPWCLQWICQKWTWREDRKCWSTVQTAGWEIQRWYPQRQRPARGIETRSQALAAVWPSARTSSVCLAVRSWRDWALIAEPSPAPLQTFRDTSASALHLPRRTTLLLQRLQSTVLVMMVSRAVCQTPKKVWRAKTAAVWKCPVRVIVHRATQTKRFVRRQNTRVTRQNSCRVLRHLKGAGSPHTTHQHHIMLDTEGGLKGAAILKSIPTVMVSLHTSISLLSHTARAMRMERRLTLTESQRRTMHTVLTQTPLKRCVRHGLWKDDSALPAKWQVGGNLFVVCTHVTPQVIDFFFFQP